MLDNKNHIPVKLHFDFESGKPCLVGLHLHGFGWVLGGGRPGQLVIKAHIDTSGECVEREMSDGLFEKFTEKIKNYDYHANGCHTFEIHN